MLDDLEVIFGDVDLGSIVRCIDAYKKRELTSPSAG